MRLSTVLTLALAVLGGCNAAESPPGDVGGGSQRPQPEPEHNRFLSIDPALVRLERTAEGLVVRGEPGAVDASDEQVVVTELRAGAPVVEVQVADDSSFTATLNGTGATQVQITPVFENVVGASLIFAIDAAGAVTRVAPPCLSGTSGLWQMGNVGAGPRTIDLDLRLENQCEGTVTVRGIALRAGTEFSADAIALPRAIEPSADLVIPMHFALASGESTRGAPRYDFLEIETDTAEAGRGFVLRVTRQPVAP